MQTNRSLFRSLEGLEKTASSNRVLNLAALSLKHADNLDHSAQPLFRSRILNACVVLKHRLRAEELGVLPRARPSATKVIVPFERSELRLGGRSFFVGEPGWMETLENLIVHRGEMANDARVLEALDELPSLDPFLLREHLKRRGFAVSPSYFEISPLDAERMYAFVGREVQRLVSLAFQDQAGSDESTARLVQALLLNGADERFEPLRRTLRMEGDRYQEGIFAWRGFLYYKWVLDAVWPEMVRMLAELARIKAVGPQSVELVGEIDDIKRRVLAKVKRNVKSALGFLKLYDTAFKKLTVAGDANAFRDFLLASPHLFEKLGECCGAVSHVTTFWRFRFPTGRPLQAFAPELLSILQDFEDGLGDGENAGSQPDFYAPARITGDRRISTVGLEA
jgi:hypothetical protein